MNTSKKVGIAFVGTIGFLMYFKRDLHRWYYINVQKLPAESYDPEPINTIL